MSSRKYWKRLGGPVLLTLALSAICTVSAMDAPVDDGDVGIQAAVSQPIAEEPDCDISPSPMPWGGPKAKAGRPVGWNFACDSTQPVVIADLPGIPQPRTYAFFRTNDPAAPAGLLNSPMTIRVGGQNGAEYEGLHEGSYTVIDTPGTHWELHRPGDFQQFTSGSFALTTGDMHAELASKASWAAHARVESAPKTLVAVFNEETLVRVCVDQIQPTLHYGSRPIRLHIDTRPVLRSDGLVAAFGPGSCVDLFTKEVRVSVVWPSGDVPAPDTILLTGTFYF